MKRIFLVLLLLVAFSYSAQAALLTNEGEEIILKCFLSATGCPTNFYIGLSDATSPCSIAETDTLADLTGEPSGNGYARVEVTRDGTGWPTFGTDSNTDWYGLSKQVTFTTSGSDWTAVNCVFLATSADNSGKLIAAVDTVSARTVTSANPLDVLFRILEQ